VDLSVDGLLISIGFILGAKTGGLITFALTVEVLFLTLAVISALQRKGANRSRLVVITGVCWSWSSK
jgi:ZIP family zinc transporter